MKSFIFDKYGYYLKEDTTKFDYNSWHFELELTDLSNEALFNMKEFLKTIPSYYKNMASDIVYSRDNKLVNESIYGNVCLIATKIAKVNVEDFISFPFYFANMADGKDLKVSYLKKVWENKVDRIEEKILTKVKIDDVTYKMLIQYYIFNVGLAENAIQYLSDTMYLYGDQIEGKTLVHKRIKDLSSYTLLNPLNFIIDFRGRDIVELLKNNLVSLEYFKNILSKYNFSQQEVSLLFARILFPSEMYDLLEEFYLIKRDISQDVYDEYKLMNEKLDKIKKIHRFLVDNYKIKPINWIDNTFKV